MSLFTAFECEGVEYTTELGFSATALKTYKATFEKTAWPDIVADMSALILQSNIPKFGEPLNTQQNLYLARHKANLFAVGNTNWIIQVVCEFVPGHRLGNKFILTTRSSVESTTTSRDWMGGLIQTGTYTSTITGDPYLGVVQPSQTVEIQIVAPTKDYVASGLVETADPESIANKWFWQCNSTAVWGRGPYQLLCVGVEHEPVNLMHVPNTHRMTFSFKANLPPPGTGLLGWDCYAEWKDANGRVPTDVSMPTGGSFSITAGPDLGVFAPVYGPYTGPSATGGGANGCMHVSPYPAMDYNATYPLGLGSTP